MVRFANVEFVFRGIKYICKLLGEPPVKFESRTINVSRRERKNSFVFPIHPSCLTTRPYHTVDRKRQM